MNEFKKKLLRYADESRAYLADKTNRLPSPQIFIVPSEAVELLKLLEAKKRATHIEIAQLRVALDEARKVIDRMWTHSRLDGQCEPQDLLDASAWLEEYPA